MKRNKPAVLAAAFALACAVALPALAVQLSEDGDVSRAYAEAEDLMGGFQPTDLSEGSPVVSKTARVRRAQLPNQRFIVYRWRDGRVRKKKVTFHFSLLDGQGAAAKRELRALVEQFQSLALENPEALDSCVAAPSATNIAFLRGVDKLVVTRKAENLALGALNVFLFPMRLGGKALLYGISVIEAPFGHQIAADLAGDIPWSTPLKHKYQVEIDPAVGWIYIAVPRENFYGDSLDEVRTVFIRADPESMRRALRGHFYAKDWGCNDD